MGQLIACVIDWVAPGFTFLSGELYKKNYFASGLIQYALLRNSVNSLNVISASSVILFRIQQVILEQDLAAEGTKNL